MTGRDAALRRPRNASSLPFHRGECDPLHQQSAKSRERSAVQVRIRIETQCGDRCLGRCVQPVSARRNFVTIIAAQVIRWGNMKSKLIVVALALLAATTVRAQTNAPASGTILFQDDFSKPANGWMASKTDYAEFGYVDGEYRILLNKADFNTYSLLPKQTFGNCSVEVDVRLAAGPANGVFGILCRGEADQQAIQKAYVFAIRADGFYAILKRTSPTFWDAIAYGKESKAIKPNKAVNRLRADCSGATLTLYVNGEKLLEKTDASFKTGQVGLAVTSQPNSEPMDVRFDNFMVRAVNPQD